MYDEKKEGCTWILRPEFKVEANLRILGRPTIANYPCIFVNKQSNVHTNRIKEELLFNFIFTF